MNDGGYVSRAFTALFMGLILALFAMAAVGGGARAADGKILANADPGTTEQSPATDQADQLFLDDIKVYFKLDSRLTQSLYMGDRWVARPSYTIMWPSVSIKAFGVKGRAKKIRINPTWVGDPEMVKIDPSQGPMVDITVLMEGQSDLLVTAHNLIRKLTVKGTKTDGFWRIDIAAKEMANATQK